MNVASNVLGGGRLNRQRSDYSGYDEDIEHEEMISQNRKEFEIEYNQQNKTRQALQRYNLQQQQERLKNLAIQEKKLGTPPILNNSQNESIGSDSPSKSSRKSAPVNVDDSSFEKPLEHIQGIHAMAWNTSPMENSIWPCRPLSRS